MTMDKITICGGGNGAQTLASVAGHNLHCDVDLFSPFGDEAERLGAGIEGHGGIETTGAIRTKGLPHRLSANPEEVIPGSDMVVLVVPAFAHETTLRDIVPYLDDTAAVGAMPARGGFDFCASRVLEEAGRPAVRLFGLQTLPWACRVQEYGRLVQVLGVKRAVDAATRPTRAWEEVAPLLERMVGVPIGRGGNMLALTLANTGQIIHPGIMYDLFRTWNGGTFEEKDVPFFYQGLSETGANTLERLSGEVQKICASLEHWGLDLSSVRELKTWLVESYDGAIEDTSSLRSAFVTNRAYAGLRAPVEEVAPGKFAPAFSARYLAEDVPYGLMVSQAIGRLTGTASPVMDEVVDWALERLATVSGSALRGRTPQAYGLNDVNTLVRFATEGESGPA